MNHLTFKEHLALFEARQPGTTKYTEKQVKNVLDRVTATLKGSEAANMTKLARRYARLEASMKKMKDEHEQLNTRLKGDVQDYFDAEDVVLTRVVETAQFTLTMAKEIAKKEGSVEIDYTSIIAALSALIPDELQARVEMITEKYTKIVPPKAPIKRLSVSKEVNEGILEEGFLERAKAFLKSIVSWATRFDSKLEALKRKAGLLNESKGEMGPLLDKVASIIQTEVHHLWPRKDPFDSIAAELKDLGIDGDKEVMRFLDLATRTNLKAPNYSAYLEMHK